MCHKIRCDGESWKLFGFQDPSARSNLKSSRGNCVLYRRGPQVWPRAVDRSSRCRHMSQVVRCGCVGAGGQSWEARVQGYERAAQSPRFTGSVRAAEHICARPSSDNLPVRTFESDTPSDNSRVRLTSYQVLPPSFLIRLHFQKNNYR